MNERQFWKRGFRSIAVASEKAFFQKVSYIHQNPIRAKLCPRPEDCRWSSASMWEACCWDAEVGLRYSDWLRVARGMRTDTLRVRIAARSRV